MRNNVQGLPLAGVEVKNVSLHNEEFIIEKDLKIGDTVIVERAGDVIPYVVGPLAPDRNGKEKSIQFPTHCPTCNTKLEKPEGEAVWRCPNTIGCSSQIEEGLIHYVSKGALDIDGFGREIVKKFMTLDFVKIIPDIYQLPFEDILKLDGWKERSVNKLRDNIEQSKTQPLWRLLVGLGIRHIGGTNAKLLVRNIESNIYDFQKMTIESLSDIEGIGPKVAESIYGFFNDPQTISVIQQLENLGVNISKGEDTQASSILNGQTFLFTGSLQQLTRDQAKELVEKNGGRNVSSVSGKLNFLVAGEKAGSKLKKAETLGTVQVISEDDFLERINQS